MDERRHTEITTLLSEDVSLWTKLFELMRDADVSVMPGREYELFQRAGILKSDVSEATWTALVAAFDATETEISAAGECVPDLLEVLKGYGLNNLVKTLNPVMVQSMVLNLYSFFDAWLIDVEWFVFNHSWAWSTTAVRELAPLACQRWKRKKKP